MRFRSPTEPASQRRRGQALIEFAIIAFVLTFLLSAMLAFGFLLFGANVSQQAVDVAAHELARIPLPPDVEFPDLDGSGVSSTDPSAAVGGTNIFAHSKVRASLFDEQYLVITIGGPNLAEEDLPSGYGTADLNDLLGRMPLLNRLLYPLMIFDADRGVIRYPGALVTNTNTSEETVLIPVVTSRDAQGRETGIAWRAVVEEMRSNGIGPCSLLATDPGNPEFEAGLISLRLNYPAQPGSLVAYQYEHADGTIDGQAGLGENVFNRPVTAADPGVVPPSPYVLVAPADSGIGPHAGSLGLGRAFAHGGVVRPYRKLNSTEAVYRREVFE